MLRLPSLLRPSKSTRHYCSSTRRKCRTQHRCPFPMKKIQTCKSLDHDLQGGSKSRMEDLTCDSFGIWSKIGMSRFFLLPTSLDHSSCMPLHVTTIINLIEVRTSSGDSHGEEIAMVLGRVTRASENFSLQHRKQRLFQGSFRRRKYHITSSSCVPSNLR